MPSNDLCFLGACEQEQLIRSKKISVTQLITAHLDQVERFNPTLNAIVTLTAESALQAAKEADAQLARQDAIGALHGLPVAHKDLFLTKGVKTTFGSPIYKDNIPQVAAHLPLIKEVQTDHYWETINVKKLESLRVALRDLIKYLETQKQEPIYTHFEDELDYEGIEVREPVSQTYVSLQSYKDRVESYIRKNKNHLTIHKLSHNIPITQPELDVLEKILFTESVAGTKEQFVQQFGEKPLGAFIRSITGLEQATLNEAFADFLQVGNLKADQMTFVKTIISYLSKNGTIDKTMLYEQPFTDINSEGIDKVFNNDDLTKVLLFFKCKVVFLNCGTPITNSPFAGFTG